MHTAFPSNKHKHPGGRMLSLPGAIKALVQVGIDAGHHHERIPWYLVRHIVWHGQVTALIEGESYPCWGPGLLALVVGCADWGAETAMEWGPPPRTDDPAGRDWAGVGAKSGKHLLDGTAKAPYGGLSLPHWDSGALMDWYERFGWPGPEENYTYKRGRRVKPVLFDTLRRKGGQRWRVWLDWSSKLLRDPDVHVWSILKWLRETWAPSWWTVGVHEGRVNRAAINARIRNSAQTWAREICERPADEQAEYYVRLKTKRRGERAGRRAKRQIGFAKRVGVLVEAAQLEVVG